MKYLLIVIVSGMCLSACGDMVTTMAPSGTTVGCAAQTAGSLVSILDVEPPGC